MKKLDIIIIAIVLLISAASYGIITFYQTVQEDKVEVIIKHQGRIIKRYSFDDDTHETFVYEEDDEINTVVIVNSQVSITEANCRDQICVKTQSISKVGEIIVCLPHQFTVEIASKTKTAELDSIAE